MVNLRKSSEGPVPWAARQWSASTVATFDPRQQQQQHLDRHLLGPLPFSQPPIRRASLQHQKPEEGGEWPLMLKPIWEPKEEAQHRIKGNQPAQQQQQQQQRWDSQRLLATEQKHQQTNFPFSPNLQFHRRSQPQLCHANSHERAMPPDHCLLARPNPPPVRLSAIGGLRFAGFQQLHQQKVGSQPVLAQQQSGGGVHWTGTPPPSRRQLPPLVSQSSFAGSSTNNSPMGSPQLHHRKFGTFGAGGLNIPQLGFFSGGDPPMRKASAGPAFGECLFEQQQSQQGAANGNGMASKWPANGGGGSRGGVERRILLRRCPQSDLASRFQRHHHEGLGGSRGSSFSGSNESTPTRGTHQQDQEPEIIDPVYLALKQATAKYGNSAGNGSRSGSRRGSQVALAGHGHLFDADTTPSPRNLSQTSLQDSGYSGGCVEIGGSRSRLVSGSTPHLHRAGVGLANGKTTTTSAGGGGGGATTSSQQPAGTAANTGSGQQQQQSGGGRRPKLSEKMKSLSLDCAEMPAPVQPSLGRNQYYKSKPIRSARGFATSGESFEDALERSVSPPASARTVSMAAAIPPMVQPRRLPPAPTPQQQPQTAAQQPTGAAPPSAAASTMPVGTHIVIHEYIYGDCTLYLGDRLVVVDNGDPDWKHGFKVNDRLEQLYTFPSTCVSGFQPNEQPMKLIQNCNLTEQKLRLYRDQVIFVQPNSLREDGRVLIRNEHGTFAYCPLHFLQLM